MTTRLMIVDDHPLVLEGIRRMLGDEEGFTVVATARDRKHAIESAALHAPDIVLLDVRLADDSGLDLIEPITKAAPLARIVMLTVTDDAASVASAVSHGARGYVLKGASRERLKEAVNRVAAGFTYFDPEISDALAAGARRAVRHVKDAPVTLSPREEDIMRLVAAGMTNDAIASELGLRPDTVKTHLSRAFVKLGAKDRANAVAICMRRELL